MRKPKPLSKILALSRAWWKRIGDEARVRIKERTESGLDVNRHRFPPYSREYAELKAAGKFKRQSSRQVSPPDFTLTGDTLRDLQTIRVGKDYVQVGWQAYGERVLGNAERGRAITSDEHPFGVDVDEWIYEQWSKAIDRNLDDASGEFKVII